VTQDEKIQIIIDFVHGGCLDHEGNPIDIECGEIWQNYQNELAQPGCKGCIKRRVTGKYLDLIKRIMLAAKTHPGAKMDIETN
jgi:hypothetical protein